MKKLIGSKGFYKMVLAICIPIVIQNGFTNLASLLDNIMIGQLGTLSMSGVSITNQLLKVCIVKRLEEIKERGICICAEKYLWKRFPTEDFMN